MYEKWVPLQDLLRGASLGLPICAVGAMVPFIHTWKVIRMIETR